VKFGGVPSRPLENRPANHPSDNMQRCSKSCPVMIATYYGWTIQIPIIYVQPVICPVFIKSIFCV
jgi:hypothetical protein